MAGERDKLLPENGLLFYGWGNCGGSSSGYAPESGSSAPLFIKPPTRSGGENRLFRKTTAGYGRLYLLVLWAKETMAWLCPPLCISIGIGNAFFTVMVLGLDQQTPAGSRCFR